MGSILLKNATLLATFDDQNTEIPQGGVYIEDHIIRQVGAGDTLPETADQVFDMQDHLVLPGLVNTHHHLYQTLTRVVAQDANLFTWLKTLYPIWGRLTDEGVYISTLTGLAELMLSGCTTSSDHLYIYPNDCTLDSQIRAAGDIGMRFHASRGSMSLGESKGGLPPDSVVENEADILKDSQRLIETYHDASDHAMLRLVLAPCSPFSVTADLMRESAVLARQYERVRLHTHLAETLDEEQFCLEKFGMRPVDYVESLGWTGHDVWHAHCVHMNDDEIGCFAHSGTGVAHCPTSNMRLASGIAPIPKMTRAGVNVGLGVDGSASNDGSNMLAEARQAMLIQRIAPHHYSDTVPLGGREGFAGDPAAMSAREALRLATRGGAATLGRDDIGSLQVGKSADVIAVDLNRIQYAGAGHDPVAAAVFCQPFNVDLSIIHGRVVVERGQLLTMDMTKPLRRHREISKAMINGG
ncbi:MAG: Guanine deaminase (EC; Hydroxydechloroatrazine ethylaminohydrolase (EC [uncultured Thiotrichaceae bacterium]|uniref:Guanine deaminase ) n=1 Tax=uncultured Thiotrichaceae bacterium TaxID=298394 RepID=A0A6S6UC25_9GAMM|nr:MAG: Guanine deaminase (EC; Hydroxydechloroatrazine ethylaminohydrolase (EC [uncultured Thiotrichaceae bacterium]